MVFYVRNQPPHRVFKGYDVAWTLKSELRKQQSDFLIFRALEINTVSKSEGLAGPGVAAVHSLALVHLLASSPAFPWLHCFYRYIGGGAVQMASPPQSPASPLD